MSKSNNNSASVWKVKMDSYYQSASNKKLMKDLAKAGFKTTSKKTKS